MDLVDRRSVRRGLDLFTMVIWADGILGFAACGYVFATLGTADGFLVGALPIVLGAVPLLPIALALRPAPPSAA